MELDKQNWQYVVNESEHQWSKGEVLTLSFGDSYIQYRFEGASENGEQIFFREGDFGLISRLIARLSGKQPGSERIYGKGEFVEVASAKPNPQSTDYSVKAGFYSTRIDSKRN